ncbi:hypothetical protein WJX74_005789 [Apatococcus lobatus]|uniref:Endonuclease/exonuclease/phosphatase domain-containing protein n=1 Tax=Apatococcus lobatus TaxID=904363 RepID=A0AAW1SBL0_9CHLO
MELEVLTLNCWGLWLVAKQRARRLRLIAEALQRTTADVVHLQEVWCRSDADLILVEAAKGKLQHGHHFVAGHFGSGLLTLSRYPLKQVRFVQFTAAGDPVSLKGDYFAGKGVGWAQLDTPAGIVDTFNTHLSANYKQSWRDAPELGCRIGQDGNAGVRILQMQQLATFVRGSSHPDASAVILAGDLNNPPDSLHMHFMQSLLPDLKDAWVAANPKDEGPTANHPESSFSTTGAGKSPTRIDYVWTSLDCQVLSAEITMTSAEPGLSFSDHFGVSVRLHLPEHGTRPGGRQSQQPPQASSQAASFQSAALDSMQIGKATMERGSRNAAICASSLVIICILLWAFQLAFPYWSYPHALHTVFTAVLTPCCLLLPIVFFFGYGARSGEAQALHEVATEAHIRIQALTRGSHHQLSTHKPDQPAASPDVSCQAPERRAQGNFDAQHQTSSHKLSQPAASSAIAPSSARSDAPPRSHTKQEACHRPSHVETDYKSAAHRAAHVEDQSGLQTEVPGPSQGLLDRHIPSQAPPSANDVHRGGMGDWSSTSATPLLSTASNDNQALRNSMQDTALPMLNMAADAIGNGYQQQQVRSPQVEQAAAFHHRQRDMPSTAADEGLKAEDSPTITGSAGHDGLHPHLKRSIDLPSSEGPALKKPSHSSATSGLRHTADNEVGQFSQTGLQPAFSDAHQAPAVNIGASLPTSRETITLEESLPIPAQVDPVARSRSPFDRLRLEALTQGPSDGAPEPFPNADTFRSSPEDRISLQPDGPDQPSISRQQQDSFSFPPLSDGVLVRRRSPAVSMEPTRAAAGAFGSSVLNYDHQLQQRPGLLTSPSPSVSQEPAVSTSSIGNNVTQARNADLGAGIHDAHGRAAGSGSPLSIKTGPIVMDPGIQAQNDLRDTAGDVSLHAAPVSSFPRGDVSHHGALPLHDAEALLGSSLPPVSPTAQQYGHIRSGRLGEEGEGSDSRGDRIPAHDQGTGSPMKVLSNGQDLGLMHDVVPPGRSPSPHGVVRAGRLGE